MKFYLTVESKYRIQNSFLNLNAFHVIDVQEIITSFNLDLSKQTNIFIINSHIEKSILSNSKSKRLQGIIYINNSLNESVIENLYEMVYMNPNISQMVLLDDYYTPKLKSLYKNFEEILFFPSVRKIKIIECKPLNKNNEIIE